jgi:Tfp pilus assembly protein PilF
MTKAAAVIDEIIIWLVTITLALVPLFFLTVTPEYYAENKWLLIFCAALLIIVLWAVRMIVTKTVVMPVIKGGWGFPAIAVASIIGLIVASTNRVEALAQPIGPITFVSLSIIIAAGYIFRSRIRPRLTNALLLSGSLLGIVSIYVFFGIGKMLTGVAPFLADKQWTPVGSSLSLIAVFAILLPLAVGEAVSHYRRKSETQLTLTIISIIIMTAGLIITVIEFIPQAAAGFMPLGVGWTILLEMYKQPKSFFFGTGSENFTNAFSIAKPVYINQTAAWNTRFALSSTAFFHIATTLGLIGIAGFLLLLKNLLVPLTFKNHPFWKISSVLAAIVLLTVIPDLTIFAVIAAILIIRPAEGENVRRHEIPKDIHWLGTGMAIFIFVTVAVTGFFLVTFYTGDLVFAKSLTAAQKNDGTATYNDQLNAIQINPYMSSYRIAFAQVNVALANSVTTAARAKTPAADKQVQLSDSDQKLVTQFIQQAINQGKAAVQLSPANPVAWQTLAAVYQNITGVVQNADVWAVASYQQAIVLDPANPILRLNAAGAFISQGKYDQARQQLEIAAQIKPDYANTFYNLAYVYRNLKDYTDEKSALETAKKLVPAGSGDATTVAKELDSVNQELGTTPAPGNPSAQQSDNAATPKSQPPLTTPQTTPQREITPKIELPDKISSPSSLPKSLQP